MSASLVGSEMCIRDRSSDPQAAPPLAIGARARAQPASQYGCACSRPATVSYTHLTLPTICSV
eukprot:11978852-Alexandrium_andersonii.AAC.1